MLSRLTRHFLTGAELSADDLHALLDRALELKAAPDASRALEGRHVALLFEKPSTRTRVSFEAGVVELGGHPLILRADELQLSRDESPRDTALVLSRHVHAKKPLARVCSSDRWLGLVGVLPRVSAARRCGG